jgi:sugar lactone lactonase YvrE
MRSVVGRLLVAWATVGAVLVPAPVGAGDDVGGVRAPGCGVRYLVPPNHGLNQTDGMALDGKGGLYVTQALYNRVVRIDLQHPEQLTVIADETDAQPLQVPDDITLGPDGNLYVTELLGRKVTRISLDGKQRKVLGTNLGDGGTGTNGIAFNAQGRLFATDLSFSDPSHPGGLWEVDPAGVKPPVPIVRPLPTPEGFGFGPDGLAYVPEMFDGRIDVIDVDARRVVKTLVDGFGYLVALKVDRTGNLLTMETDTGKVWRVDRTSGARTLVAQGPRGLDNLVEDRDGTIYVSNFAQGNVYRVDQAAGTFVPLVPDRSLTLPFSLSEAEDGSLVVGDFTAVARVSADGRVTRPNRLLVDGLQLLTPGAVQVGRDLYSSDFLPPEARLFRIDLDSGKRHLVANGFGFPWTVREGPGGWILVGDQALGAVFSVDPATGVRYPLVQGLRSPSGLALDRDRGVVYVSDTGGGQVLAVPSARHDVPGEDPGTPTVVATGLSNPEGVAVDPDGTLLVVEGDAGRLVRLDPSQGTRHVVAEGLPTRTVGIGVPLMNYSSDVLVRRDGTIVVSGNVDGSLIELSC